MTRHLVRRGLARVLGAAAALLLLSAAPAAAQAVEQFYRAKNITFVIPFDPGGGYDLYARLVARHIGKHVPGRPTVIPQNMPGAGGLKAINYIFTRAPRDGSVLGIPASDVALNEALGSEGIEYKADQFNWIGRVSFGVDLTVTWNSSKAKTIADAQAHEIPLAAAGATSPGTLNPKLLNAIVGTKFKLIAGYPSSNDMLIAMERGETEGAYTSWTSLKATRPEWLRENKVNILVVYGTERFPEIAHVPHMVELGRTPEDRQLLGLYATGATIGKAVLSPPAAPAERVAALRAAFDAMVQDKEFLAEIERSKIDFGPLSGGKLQEIIADTPNIPAAVLERARAVHRTIEK